METIYSFITNQEVSYNKAIELEDGWFWSMKEHLRLSFLYKNSQFSEDNDNRELRPSKNIILAIVNGQYRTEGFDVKDIELYVDDADDYYKSFLTKKYHDNWVLKNSLDTFIDELVESYVDYGGVLVKNVGKSKPEVVDLRTLDFCDQTNILSHPFAIKHKISVSDLRKMDKWNNKDEIIILNRDEEGIDPKEIEIYEVHGVLPKDWLQDNNDSSGSDDGDWQDKQQIQVVAFYTDKDNQKHGITLFSHEEPELPFKFLARDEIKGRALGRGGIEELFEAQIWTNWNEIKITEMLEAASKNIYLSDDPMIAAKHPSGLKGMDNLEIVETQENKKGLWSIDFSPRNLVVFNDALSRWQDHAQMLGAVNDSLLGETPSAGTPFKLYEAQLMESKSMHRYRQGKIAVFVEEIYREWILPHIKKEISSDYQFLAELSADEMMSISEAVITKQINKELVKMVLDGKPIPTEMVEELKNQKRQLFMSGGNKKFIKILKDDLKGKSLDLKTNIAGKQKNLALLTDKVVNIIKQFIATPQIRQDPEMVKLLNVVLESSGLSPMLFGAFPMGGQEQNIMGQNAPAKATTVPIEQLSQIGLNQE